MGSALAAREGVDLVDDDGRDGAKRLPRLACEHEVEGFGGRDEDVGRIDAEATPLLRWRVAGPHAHGRARLLGSRRSRALDLSGFGSFSVRFGRCACVRLSRGRAARIRSGSFTREGAGCAAVRFACGFSGFAGLTDGPRPFGDAEFTREFCALPAIVGLAELSKAPRGAFDAGQRPPQIAFDVGRQRLERRDVEDAHTLGFAVFGRAAHEPVDRAEEGGECLSRAGGRDDEGVLPSAYRRPCALLNGGRPARKGGEEPRARGP